MHAVSIGTVPVFPCLAPRDACQNKHDGRRASAQSHFKVTQRALFGHVRRGTVMIQSVRPILHAPRDEMKLSWVQIPGGGIYAQSIALSRGRNALGRANGSAIKQQLRKECRSIADLCRARDALKHVERRCFRTGWVRRQVEQRHAFIMPKRIGHVRPVEGVRRSPQRFNAMRRRFVILAPSHARETG